MDSRAVTDLERSGIAPEQAVPDAPFKSVGRESEYLREWRARNPGKQKAYTRRYIERHGEERVRESRKKWAAANPERQKATRNAWRKKNRRKALSTHYKDKFGQPLEYFEDLLSQQGGGCGICSAPLRFGVRGQPDCAHVDHDHKTGVVRGVLCMRCNQQLGHYEAWPAFAVHAANYLGRAGGV